MSKKHNKSSKSATSPTSLPKGWPSPAAATAAVEYLHAPKYSNLLDREVIRLQCAKHARSILKQQQSTTTPPPPPASSSTPMILKLPLTSSSSSWTKSISIRQIEDVQHPAHGQCGLYAAQHLLAGSFILPYFGLVHTSSEADPESDYDLSLDRFAGIGVDATHCGNEARFINDYRGTPNAHDGPNAEFREILLQFDGSKKGTRGCCCEDDDDHYHHEQLERAMGVFVLPAGKSGKRAKGIARGQEILVSYGKGFWSERRAAQEDEHDTGAAEDQTG